jgi:hypothetical protein
MPFLPVSAVAWALRRAQSKRFPHIHGENAAATPKIPQESESCDNEKQKNNQRCVHVALKEQSRLVAEEMDERIFQ